MQGSPSGYLGAMTLADMIAALPADRQAGAWEAYRRQQVDTLHRIMASGDLEGVENALRAIAASEGPDVAERLRAAWQESGDEWLARQDALASPQAQGRAYDRVTLLAAEGHPWAEGQIAAEGHRQAS